MDEATQSELIAAEYESAGYKVDRQRRLGDIRVNLWAERPGDTVIIEIVNKPGDRRSEIRARADRLARAIQDLPNARIEFRFLDPSVDELAPSLNPLAPTEALALLRSIRGQLHPFPRRLLAGLTDLGRYDSFAFLVSWHVVAQSIRGWAQAVDPNDLVGDDLQAIYVYLLQENANGVYDPNASAKARGFRELNTLARGLLSGANAPVSLSVFRQVDTIISDVEYALEAVRSG